MTQKYFCALEEPSKGIFLEVVAYDGSDVDDDVHLSITTHEGMDVMEVCLTKQQVKQLIADLERLS